MKRQHGRNRNESSSRGVERADNQGSHPHLPRGNMHHSFLPVSACVKFRSILQSP
jgi:hypothetical protein